jgi:hypothetical protein
MARPSGHSVDAEPVRLDLLRRREALDWFKTIVKRGRATPLVRAE